MDIISLRRDLHQHPEVGFTEFRTASIVVEKLTALGYEVLIGKETMDSESRFGVPSDEVLQKSYERALKAGAKEEIIEKMKGGYTGVVGIMEGKNPGPTVAFRFDMDALPVKESKDDDHLPQKLGFRSKHEGEMHACAHDGHTAIGLTLAEKLSDGNFSGKVKLIFQPAEEGVRGAYSMVKKGILDDVDYLYCQHLGIGVPTGEIYAGTTGFLATTKMEGKFYGMSSHAGAWPEKGKNALLGAATALLNIHALPRFSSSTTRVNVGLLEGGTAANIIPDFARIVVETRSTKEEDNKELENRVKEIIAHSAAMHGLDHKVDITGAAIPIKCDEEAVQIAMEEAEQIDGITSVKGIQFANIGSEDASFMIKRVQEKGGKGTFMVIGSNISAPHHNPKFDIDEKSLQIGVDLLYRIAKRLLQSK